MVAYELYLRNRKGEAHLLGILPERRKHPARITKESVLRWGELVLGNGPNGNLKSPFRKGRIVS
jgi:hypothetical protein